MTCIQSMGDFCWPKQQAHRKIDEKPKVLDMKRRLQHMLASRFGEKMATSAKIDVFFGVNIDSLQE